MDSPYAWLGALCGVVGAAVLGYPILRKGPSFWFQRRFLSHRLGGLSFLLCWTYCWYLWVTDVERLLQTNLVMVCCLLGYYQCASAIWEFRFLRKRADMGFFSDKGVLSRQFVLENFFFQHLLVFAHFLHVHRDWIFARPLVYWPAKVFAFLCFAVVRPFFPHTSTRKADKSGEENGYRSEELRGFYRIGSMMFRFFYLWIKHVVGLGMQAAVWNGFTNAEDVRTWMIPLHLLNIATLNVGVFLHTLRFKRMAHPVITFSAYLAMAYASFLFLPSVIDVLIYRAPHWSLYGLVGIPLNLLENRVPLHLLWLGGFLVSS